MKKMVFILAVLGYLSGCARNSRPDFKVAVQGGEEKTPPLNIKAEQQMPVEIKTPVEIEAREGKALPVEVKTPIEIRAQGGQRLPVDVNIQGDKGLPIRNGALNIAMKPDTYVAAAVVIAFFAALFTLLSAIGAWKAARNTQKAAEGQLFLVLMKESSSKKMQDYVEKIKEYIYLLEESERNPEAVEDMLSSIALTGDAKGGNPMADAYHHVSCYLLNALSLYRLGYIRSKACFKSVCSSVVYTTEVLEILKSFGKHYVCERYPEDIATNDKKMEDEIAKLHQKYNEIINLIEE